MRLGKYIYLRNPLVPTCLFWRGGRRSIAGVRVKAKDAPWCVDTNVYGMKFTPARVEQKTADNGNYVHFCRRDVAATLAALRIEVHTCLF